MGICCILSIYTASSSVFVQDMVIDQDTGDIWLNLEILMVILKLEASENYEQTASIESYARYTSSVSINDGLLYSKLLFVFTMVWWNKTNGFIRKLVF